MGGSMTEGTWTPLRQFRVLDFGWVVSGPFAGLFASELGADVIKIETRQHADNLRLRGATRGGHVDWARADNVPLHHALNRGKRSFSVDLKRDEGLEIVRQLVARSDGLIENFTVGALERMGLPDDVLRLLNPNLVRVSLTPAGRRGSLAGLRGYAATTGALAGLEGSVGYPDSDGPTGMLNFGIADYAAGAIAAFTLVAALTGQGSGYRSVDVSQVAANTAGLGLAFAARAAGWKTRPGNANPRVRAQGVFESCDGGFVAVTVRDRREVADLADLIGGESDFAEADVVPALASWISTRSRTDAVARLRARDIRAAAVLDMDERRSDPRFIARQFDNALTKPDGQEVTVPRMPWLIDGAPTPKAKRGPKLGEHTREICQDLLQLPDETITQLVRDGVLDTGVEP
jgi:crotonobetainyl-CoA:carnitine CoA-transferase CaiB-like acyl-CoA transferase